MSEKITDRVVKIAEPYLKESGFRVYDITYQKEATGKVLRLYIDKTCDYVGIDDCERVSRWLSDRLDEADFISEAYTLEVSSPGIERVIKYDWHFDEAKGKAVTVRLFNKINNKKTLVGILKDGGEKKDIILEIDKEEITVKRDNIVDIKIYFEFGGN